MIIVDTREPFEYAMSHVEGAINISPMDFMSGKALETLGNISKDEQIILYCHSGQRSNTCSMILRQHGYTNLVNGVNEHRVKNLLDK